MTKEPSPSFSNSSSKSGLRNKTPSNSHNLESPTLAERQSSDSSNEGQTIELSRRTRSNSPNSNSSDENSTRKTRSSSQFKNEEKEIKRARRTNSDSSILNDQQSSNLLDEEFRTETESRANSNVINITLVGAGQVSAAFVFLFCEASKDINIENLRNQTNHPEYRVNILARENGDGYKIMKQNGVYIKYREPTTDGELQIKEKTYEPCVAPELQNLGSFYITGDEKTIPASDFIIMAVNNVSGTYNEEFIEKIKYLVDHAKDPNQVRVVMAQNGIPASYIDKYDNKTPNLLRTSSLSQNSEDGACEYDENLQQELNFLNRIGREKIIVCSLNLACQRVVDARREGSRNSSAHYILSTPLDKIHIPSYNAVGLPTHNNPLRKFWEICEKSRINVYNSNHIEHEMFKKLQVNMINPICAITGKNIGEVLDNSVCSTVFDALMKEVQMLTNTGPLRSMAEMQQRLLGSRKHHTSMSHTFVNGGEMETNLLLGRTLVVADNIVSKDRECKIIAIRDTLEILQKMQEKRDNCLQEGYKLSDAVQVSREFVADDFEKLYDLVLSLSEGKKEFKSTMTDSERKKEIKNLEKQKIESPTSSSVTQVNSVENLSQDIASKGVSTRK